MNLSDCQYDLAVIHRFMKISENKKKWASLLEFPWKIECFREILEKQEHALLDKCLQEVSQKEFDCLVRKYSLRMIPINSIEYPSEFAVLSDKPVIIAVCGNQKEFLSHLEKNSISVVGTRKNNSYGRMISENLGKFCGKGNIRLISGLAMGVDSLSMKSCLDSDGKCAGVIAGGFEKGIPNSSRGLFLRTLEKGFCITESDVFSSPQKFEFVQRNRLISALSSTVVIAQAPEKSGALHTARFALSQGKILLAVPGRIDDSLHRGGNLLISDNYAGSLMDLQRIGEFYPDCLKILHQEKSTDKLEKLWDGEMLPGELVGIAGNTLTEVLSKLSEMELKGKAEKDLFGRYRQIP